jgi:hypothetical protein
MKRLCTILLALAVFTPGDDDMKDSYMPKEGNVPTEEVAIKIAVAVWEPIYGAKQIEGEKPYHATLDDGVWTVEGTLPEGMKGGVALAEIAKKDGRILRVIHGK